MDIIEALKNAYIRLEVAYNIFNNAISHEEIDKAIFIINGAHTEINGQLQQAKAQGITCDAY